MIDVEKIATDALRLDATVQSLSILRKQLHDIRRQSELRDVLSDDAENDRVRRWPVDRGELNQTLRFIDKLQSQVTDQFLVSRRAVEFESLIGSRVYFNSKLRNAVPECGCFGPYYLESIHWPDYVMTTVLCERGHSHEVDIRDLMGGPFHHDIVKIDIDEP